MKNLLLWGGVFLVLSCLLVSCSNEGLSAMAADGEKETVLTTCLGLDSRGAFESENLELFYVIDDASAISENFSLASFRRSLGEDVSLDCTDIEKQGQVFTAGRAWLSRGEVGV